MWVLPRVLRNYAKRFRIIVKLHASLFRTKLYFYPHDVIERVITGWWCSNKNPRETKSDGNCRPNREGCRLEVGWYYIPGFYCLLGDIRDLVFVTSICLDFPYRQFVAKTFMLLCFKGHSSLLLNQNEYFKWDFGKIDAKVEHLMDQYYLLVLVFIFWIDRKRNLPDAACLLTLVCLSHAFMDRGRIACSLIERLMEDPRSHEDMINLDSSVISPRPDDRKEN